MAYQYPYDEELRKVPLNPDMIRHRVREDAKHSLLVGCFMSIPLLLLCALVITLFCAIFPWSDAWRGSAVPMILGIAFLLLFSAGIVAAVGLLASSIKGYLHATRGEIAIEIDSLSYIEHDRPRVVRTHRSYRTVYEDFLHFKSGREMCDSEKKYRHQNGEAEEFITVSYAAEHEHILCIYRLKDYNWQP